MLPGKEQAPREVGLARPPARPPATRERITPKTGGAAAAPKSEGDWEVLRRRNPPSLYPLPRPPSWAGAGSYSGGSVALLALRDSACHASEQQPAPFLLLLLLLCCVGNSRPAVTWRTGSAGVGATWPGCEKRLCCRLRKDWEEGCSRGDLPG